MLESRNLKSVRVDMCTCSIFLFYIKLESLRVEPTFGHAQRVSLYTYTSRACVYIKRKYKIKICFIFSISTLFLTRKCPLPRD
jgi:hypothetical protein